MGGLVVAHCLAGKDEIPGMPKFLRRPEVPEVTPFSGTTRPTPQAGIPSVSREMPNIQMVGPRMRPMPKPEPPAPFAGVIAPQPQAGIPRVGNEVPSVRFGPEPPPPPKPDAGTFSVMRPEPQAGIPRVANTAPSVAFGEPPKPPGPALGSPENPGWSVKLPGRMPKVAAEEQKLDNIVTPERAAAERSAPRVGSEGSAARWTNNDAMRILRDSTSSMADKREAAMTLGRRGIELPENYRYLAGNQAPGSVVYNPRNVTRFTAGGESVPIKQGGKWKPMQ